MKNPLFRARKVETAGIAQGKIYSCVDTKTTVFFVVVVEQRGMLSL
jgi:hypothetical protein